MSMSFRTPASNTKLSMTVVTCAAQRTPVGQGAPKPCQCAGQIPRLRVAVRSAFGSGSHSRRRTRVVALGDKSAAIAAAAVEAPPQEIHELEEPVEETGGETFRWLDHWYPIHVLDAIDPSRPHYAQLLGRDLVLWRDGQGQWNCMEDFCPHRLAPLSEGRVEADGQLLCAYHGWRFDSTGKCTDLPQAKQPVSEWDSKKIPCAVSYPTMEKHGLLFVWPQAGAEAEAQARATEPRGYPEMVDEKLMSSGKAIRTSWVIRDVPFGWDFFMENATDPAHVPVSHHGIVGDRYNDPKYFELHAERKPDIQEGFKYRMSTSLIGTMDGPATEFQPPCHIRIASDNRNGQPQTNVCLFAVPTSPGHCRTFACQTVVAGPDGNMKGNGFVKFSAAMPKWVDHMLGTMFVHQDMVFLHHQEKIVAKRLQREGIRTVDGYIMPTPSDKMTVMFRTWFERFSGGIPWAPGTPMELPPAERDSAKLFDVYNSHTKHCTHCQGALKGTRLWQKITAGLAIVSLACGTRRRPFPLEWLCLVAPHASLPPSALPRQVSRCMPATAPP
mmetsp:Transcript_28071/g.72193  ORF Transcript_28071/g.72193 Transcript_28071/m.72193 type:complete len:555 (+) Transcript_28071:218-1882(+)